MTNFVTLSGMTSDEIWPKLERVVNDCFPTQSRTDSESGTETRERERDKTIQEAVGLLVGSSRRQNRIKIKDSLS